ncbi:MAG: VCBS domain-containing protein, partial [Endozoicomonas sp.]
PGLPSVQDSIEVFEENPLVIFIDRDFSAHHFESIEIASFPRRGALLYNGSPVDIEGIRVSRTDLLSGRLKFYPVVSELLEGAAGFDYRVIDGGLESDVQRFVYGVQADAGSTGTLVAGETVEDKTVKDEHHKTLDASGCFTASDFGGKEPQFEHHVCEGLFGTLSVHQDGKWEYCALADQAAFQSLGQNGHLIETIEVASLEGETCQLMILIKGMEHEAVIASSKCL